VSASPAAVCAIVTTFKRPGSALYLICQLTELSEKLNPERARLDIYIADDDPSATWFEGAKAQLPQSATSVTYVRRLVNLGQGPNLLQALADVDGYDYCWCLGDDDRIDVRGLAKFFDRLGQLAPTLGVFGFAQGTRLEFGTEFVGETRIITEVDAITTCVARFGKGTNLVIKFPTEEVLNWVAQECRGCMYEDRAIAYAALFMSGTPRLLLEPKVLAYGTKGFGRLRYSQRVFPNLEQTLRLAEHRFSSKPAIAPKSVSRREVWRWWARGLATHFYPYSPISYTPERLRKEFAYPFLRLSRLWRRRGIKPELFEPPDS